MGHCIEWDINGLSYMYNLLSECQINNELYDILLIHKPNLLVTITFTAYCKEDRQFKTALIKKASCMILNSLSRCHSSQPCHVSIPRFETLPNFTNYEAS